MLHLLQVSLYHDMFKKKTFQIRRSRIYREISDLSAYTAGANSHIRFISDLFLHMNEAWNQSEDIGINVICLHGLQTYTVLDLGHLNHAV